MARRSRKQDEVMDSLSGDAGQVSTSDDDSAPLTAARREAALARHVSLKEAALWLDRDRNTLMKWIEKEGCPYVQKADRDLGRPWVLDVAEVVRWLEKRAADATAEKLGGTADGVTSEDEAKRRKAVAQAVVAELDMLERLRSVVPVDDVTDLWSKDYAEVRGKMMSLPDVLAANVDPAIASLVRGIAEKHVRSTLDSLKTGDTLLKWK